MKNAIWLLGLLFLAACGGTDKTPSTVPANPDTHQEGKAIFYAKCASCHMVNKELTGPALRGVESRWPDSLKLYAFIRNSQEVIKTDEYAHDLWMRFNQTIMNEHPDLTDAQIRAVLDYINAVSEKP